MQAIVIRAPGGYDRLELVASASPQPAPGEVVVRTACIGVNYADCIVRMGLYASAKKYVGWPITPGFEWSGEVESVGDGVRDLARGDRVFGVTRFGGYATHVAVPRDQVFLLPDGMSFAEAAAFPAAHLTAWFALFDLVRLRPGMRVLVHSAAGGVGSALVQLAAGEGCEVTGVVGAPHKVQAARALGAAQVIDKSRDDLWRRARSIAANGFDVVLDANGVSTLRESYEHLGSPGRLVVYGFHSMIPRRGGRPNYAKLAADWVRTPRFNPLAMTNANRSVLAFNLSYLFENKNLLADGMRDLLARRERGTLRAPTITEYRFADVARAHRDIESGQTVGKLVLVLS